MPDSGRSQPSIIELANFLIDWVMTDYPVPEVARILARVAYIEPVPRETRSRIR